MIPGLHTVALADTPAQPWKNGGGVTRELLAWPTAADGVLRVSIAEVDRDGPFSAWPGIDRSFAVLQGAGVRLHFEDGVHRLTPSSAALHFDGGLAPGCRLLGGPTLDLNVFTRRGAGRAVLERVCPSDVWRHPAALHGVFTLAPATLRDGNHAHALPAGTLAWRADAEQAEWTLSLQDEQAPAWWLAFEATVR